MVLKVHFLSGEAGLDVTVTEHPRKQITLISSCVGVAYAIT